MIDKVIIQPVSIIDLEMLQSISVETFRKTFQDFNSEEDMAIYIQHAFSKGQLESELMEKLSQFFFAQIDDEIVGYLKLKLELNSQEQSENRLEIERIYVLNHYQGYGIGQKLMTFAQEYAIENNIYEVYLGVWENNKKAIKFYQKNGFKNFGQHQFQLGNDVQTDILMSKQLTSK